MKVCAIVEKATTKVDLGIKMESGAAQTPHAALTKEMMVMVPKKFHAKEEH